MAGRVRGFGWRADVAGGAAIAASIFGPVLSAHQRLHQLLLPAVPNYQAVLGARGDTFLGSGMTRSVQHSASLAAAAWIHARLDTIDADGFVGEVVILDDDGRVLITMEGLGVRRIDPEQLRRATERSRGADAQHVLEGPPADRARRLRAWLADTLHGDGDLQALVRLGLVPEAQLAADMLPLIVPALRADLELVLRHKHRDDMALACPIVALLGTDDRVIGRHQVTGWAAHTDHDFVLRRVPGGHLFYRDAPAETWGTLAPLLT